MNSLRIPFVSPCLHLATAILASLLWVGQATAATDLNWDPGDTQAGSQAVAQPDTTGGGYLYRVVVPAGATDGMRVRLTVTAGEAHLYLKQGAEPTTGDFNFSSTEIGSDLLLLQNNEFAAGQEWFVLVDAQLGAEWSLLAGDAAMPLSWDPGDTHSGTVVYQHPGSAPGWYWFKINPQEAVNGGWRNALAVTSGDANLYLRRGSLPDTVNRDFASERAGSDGFVVRADQFQAGEDWYLLVRVPVAASWSLVCGDIYIEDLGKLKFTDADADGSFDFTETPLESGSGVVPMGPEGIRYFKATVPPGTPAWSLWLGGGANVIHVRKNTVPFPDPGWGPFAYAERVQAGKMLLVPDYLQASSDTYFIGVPGTPDADIHLRSVIHTFTEIPFDSTRTVTCTGTDAGYRTFRLQVPIDQIAWENAVTNVSGDGNVCLRRDEVPNEWHNDAIADSAGVPTDSVTLSPPTLTNGTFFVTIYGTTTYQVSFRNGNPVVTHVPFIGQTVNNTPDKTGWRYYSVTDIGLQFGLGWELELTGAPAGTEIAIRRNAVPARWRERDNDWPGIYTDNAGHVDHSSTNGLLQQVDHQADVWYIGVYHPTQALGAFTLTRRLATATTLAFGGGATPQTGHLKDVWRWFRVDVPAGPVGWDLRLRDVTAGTPRIAVRRDYLPGQVGTTGGWYPGNGTVWPSGHRWAEWSDLTDRWQDLVPPADRADAACRHLTVGMGHPLEPGTYYVGVHNDSNTGESAAYTLESRGIGSGREIGVTDLAFSGGSAPITGLGVRDPAVFKVTVPAATRHWSLHLAAGSGELMMAVLKGAVPSDGGYSYNNPWQADSAGVRAQKSGDEYLTLFPPEGQTELAAGDYYIAVLAEGGNPPATDTFGEGASSGTITSLGTPLADLGTAAAGVPLSQAVSLAAGQTKVFTVVIPEGTASLEAKLLDRVGAPHLTGHAGSAAATASGLWWYEYGHEGGQTTNSLSHASVITFTNPPAGPFTFTVQARADGNGVYHDASATLVITPLPPQDVIFDGGTAAITAQDPATWRFFKVTVPAGSAAVGWDLRLREVTGGLPRMVVRRDMLPVDVNTTAGWWNPGNYDTWTSGNQWAEQADLTERWQDPGSVNASNRHLTMGMGRPLEPGDYYIGVRNDSTTGDPASYVIESRGIGADLAVPVVPLDFAGGEAAISGLEPRDLRVFKVTVPADTRHWSMSLVPTSGEMMMAVLKGAVPSDGGYLYSDPAGPTSSGVRAQKPGAEYLSVFPTYEQTVLAEGDYYIAVLGEGDSPADSSTFGAGTAAGIFTSLGSPVSDLGTPEVGTPLSQTVSLAGGQTKVFTVQVPEGTASLEVRLDDRTGDPYLTGHADLTASTATGSWWYDYGHEGGQAIGSLMHASVLTFVNPTVGPYTITVQARDADTGIYHDASGTLVVTAMPPQPVVFDGGSAAVTGHDPATWRFFKVTVPDGPVGWDLRLRDVTGGTPRMVVRRDALPTDVATTVGWYPGGDATWPSGHQWAEYSDLTDRWQGPGWLNASNRHLTVGMGRPLEPGEYFIGVRNDSTTAEPASYTLESRGIGPAMAMPVTSLAFTGGSSTVSGLEPGGVAVYKVSVPANTRHWSLRLETTSGEMMMAVLKGTVPSDGGYSYTDPSQPTSPGVRMQKTGSEYLSLFPVLDEEYLREGDYYIAVLGEGAFPPDASTFGTGLSSGTLTSAGSPLTDIGAAAVGSPAGAPVSLAAGETKVFTVQVAAGAAALEVRLNNRAGNPYLTAIPGAVASTATAAWWSEYGYEGGHNNGALAHGTVATFANPPAGPFTIAVRSRADNSGNYRESTADLVVTPLPPIPLNFGSYANSGGGTNQDTRQIIDNQKVLYQVEVPATVAGQPVLGWKLDAHLAQGDVRFKVFQDAATRTPYFESTLDTVIVAPPFLIPGGTWFVEITGIGITEYTLTSDPVGLLRPAWTMPVDGQWSTTPGLSGGVTFGDSGIDPAGVALADDQGLDLGQEDWRFYAVTVPSGNRRLLRTVLEALNGQPQLYIRAGAIPTTQHAASPPNGYPPLYQYSSTATGTQYGNWTPMDARFESELAPGTWYLGVTAAGGTNCRYRLRTAVGDFQPLAMNGGSFTGQDLLGGDWRYYVLETPATPPANWNVTFATQQGAVQVHWRDTLPPGDAAPYDGLRNAYDDQLNQGPYSYDGWSSPGTYTVTSPPLRPNSRIYLGVKALSDASFSISSATGGSAPVVPASLDFFTGRFEGNVPLGDGLVFRIDAPVDAYRFKFHGTHSGNVEFRLEQGTWPGVSGAVHQSIGLGWPDFDFNQVLAS
ncbi:MAG: hypothetical protein K9N23_21975, partial [Akkermansiaceae bacterium]|nr:hypothetical protein [Akkermansiaceae bacterium]